MATRVTIGGQGALFRGEDKRLELHVLDVAGASVDITGWTIQLIVHKTDVITGTPVITQTATISGVYAALNNPQRAVVTLTDADLSIPATTYRHSLKRTNDGNETVLAWGSFVVEDSTQD